MKNCIINLLMILLISLISCKRKESNYIFEERQDLDLSDVKIDEVISLEKRLHSIVKENDTLFNIGTYHYPDIKSITHKVFQRRDSKLLLRSDYYFTKKDSLLKIVIYDWTVFDNFDWIMTESQFKHKVHDSVITNKFNKLGKIISLELDKDHNLKKSSPLENMKTWESKNKIVFMSLMGEKKPFQIRLFIGSGNPNYMKEDIPIVVDSSSNSHKNGL